MNQQYNSFLGSEEQPVYTPTSEERMMAILSHILCLVFVVGLIAPLIIYLIKKSIALYCRSCKGVIELSDHGNDYWPLFSL